jgi:hypothetical protein
MKLAPEPKAAGPAVVDAADVEVPVVVEAAGAEVMVEVVAAVAADDDIKNNSVHSCLR